MLKLMLLQESVNSFFDFIGVCIEESAGRRNKLLTWQAGVSVPEIMLYNVHNAGLNSEFRRRLNVQGFGNLLRTFKSYTYALVAKHIWVHLDDLNRVCTVKTIDFQAFRGRKTQPFKRNHYLPDRELLVKGLTNLFCL